MTKTSTHLDATLSIDERVDLLLGQMTVREKAFQLTSAPPWWLVASEGPAPEGAQRRLAEDPPGFICNFGVDDPAAMADVVGRLQLSAVEGTRLGIPLLVHVEALNGVSSGGHMVFPTAIGLSATWSPELVEEMADLMRRQMLRIGVRQALSPNMDIALDPRWGRVHETYGEDPYLVAALSVAFTRGLQGDDLREGVIATAKHFIGYGMPQGGLNLSAYEAGPRLTRDLFAFPFEAAIQKAGLASVMNSYADVDGIPAAASPAVLEDLLRGTLGFDGFVTSDYTTMQHLVGRQRVARTPGGAGALTLAAGMDTEFPTPFAYGATLVDEIEAGRIPVEHLDRSVRRVLAAKFRLGLFENPMPAERIDVAEVAGEGRELSLELARRSVVLVQNDGILPLAAEATRIAVVGPHAEDVMAQFPTYTYPAFRAMLLHMSSGGAGNNVGIDPELPAWFRSAFGQMTPADFVRERLGAVSLAESVVTRVPAATVVQGCTVISDLGDAAIADAVAAAGAADVVVLALGGASLWFNGERTEGEGSDSADISLPPAQIRLAEAVAATGTPIVVVLTQGRAYALPDVVTDAAAIIVAPFGGPMGPESVAEIIFGEVEPSGRLPYSIPRHSGQLPVYHHQRAGTGFRNPLPPAVPHHYLDMAATPLWSFGHGLAYTDFAIEDLVADPEFATGGTAHVRVTVTNVGDRSGVAVPQLYARVDSVGTTRPAQQLVGFARVPLEPGKSVTCIFTVAASQLGHTGMDGCFGVDPDPVEFSAGLSSDRLTLSAHSQMTGSRRLLTSGDREFFSQIETRIVI